jgi:hypothetical protein
VGGRSLGGLFIGLGVRAHADHRPKSKLQPNRRFIKSLFWIGYEFDSRFLTILLLLQAFTEGIRRWRGVCMVTGVQQAHDARGAVASMTAQLRATGGRTTTPELRSATRLGCHIGLGGRVPAGPVWAGASELGYQGGLRGGGRKRKKERAGIKAAGLH